MCNVDLEENMTLEQWLAYWFNTYAKRNVKQSTAISYIGYINNHVVPQIGQYAMSELTTDIFQDFFNNQYDIGNLKNGKQLSPKTLHNIRLMLRTSMKKAVEIEILNRNHVEFVELPKIVKPQMRVLTISEHQQLNNTLKHTKEKLFFGVQLSLMTGMRLGEVLGLRWGDIDLETNYLHIRRTVNRLSTLDGETKTEIVIGTPKSEKSVRSIPFTDAIKNVFLNYQTKYMEMLGIKFVSKNDYVVSTKRGYPVEPKTMQSAFERIIKEAGIEKTNFHALRHTFATRAIEKGIDVKTLSILLGHADVTTTVNLFYGHAYQSSRYSKKVLCYMQDNIILFLYAFVGFNFINTYTKSHKMCFK